jgi:Fur family ferric uptake transcriptional regulator
MVRKTKQREAVRKAFLKSARPMTPAEVRERADSHSPGIGIATVYRTLKLLCDEGWLVPVALPGEETTYYERAQKHHHHFVCRSCDRLFKVSGCPTNLERLTPRGCSLEDHELLLYGRCASCNGAAK